MTNPYLLLMQEFPDARVVEQYDTAPNWGPFPFPEEQYMTEQNPPQEQNEDWGQEEPQGETTPGPWAVPQAVNPHNHAYTWSPKLADGSMLVIRAQSAEELATLTEALVPVVGRLTAAWQQATGRPAPQQQAPQAPNQWQQAAQQQYTQAPMPMNGPPQAAWQQAGAPQGQQWGGAEQGGGGQGNDKPQPRPRPDDWGPQVWRVEIPRGDGRFKAWRQANGQLARGKIRWAGGGGYWIHPEIVQAVGQNGFNPVPA